MPCEEPQHQSSLRNPRPTLIEQLLAGKRSSNNALSFSSSILYRLVWIICGDMAPSLVNYTMRHEVVLLLVTFQVVVLAVLMITAFQNA
ncbi:hypothetical protein B0O99DRAFT_632951 [Bisporella sp. PMI_857]|nr:hypothetical protein B0O99DRAFT_632951 [Bisporella sp. PMI_857]